LNQNLFGVEPIVWQSIDIMQRNAPEIIVWAAPIMFAFVLLEIFFSYHQRKGFYDTKESIGSLLIGIGNVVISIGIKVVLFYAAVVIYNFLPWRMEFNWWLLLPCYVLFDFCSYWTHRLSHRQRFWWATHVPHHSGEHYNLTTSFRLSWVQYIKIIFFLPVPLLGTHPVMFFIINQVATLYQFWLHTEYIRKLPAFIEYIFVTPSHHRVHHGSQDKYLNKNFGASFIIWDRLFGTYQSEEEQPLYGITHPIKERLNPMHINFHEYVSMFQDVKSVRDFRSKIFFIFGDPIAIDAYKKLRAIQKPQ
jgi:sterol desaturase/sphingolipid hydroxylase (fatty acid hydroxylase superfamily)